MLEALTNKLPLARWPAEDPDYEVSSIGLALTFTHKLSSCLGLFLRDSSLQSENKNRKDLKNKIKEKKSQMTQITYFFSWFLNFEENLG